MQEQAAGIERNCVPCSIYRIASCFVIMELNKNLKFLPWLTPSKRFVRASLFLAKTKVKKRLLLLLASFFSPAQCSTENRTRFPKADFCGNNHVTYNIQLINLEAESPVQWAGDTKKHGKKGNWFQQQTKCPNEEKNFCDYCRTIVCQMRSLPS